MSPKTCQRATPAGCGGPRPRGTPDGSAVGNQAAAALRHPLPSPRTGPDRTREERDMTVTMQVRKRNGDAEDVDVNKIVRAVQRVADDLTDVDPMRVATRTISGLYDGATTAELDRLSIRTSAEMIGEEPQYSQLAGRLLAGYID